MKLLECRETALRLGFILRINIAILGAPHRTVLEDRQIHSSLNTACNYIFNNIWPGLLSPCVWFVLIPGFGEN